MIVVIRKAVNLFNTIDKVKENVFIERNRNKVANVVSKVHND